MAYHLVFSLALFTIVTGSVLFWTRAYWTAPVVEVFVGLVERVSAFFANCFRCFRSSASGRYTALPTSFAGDAEAGLSSSTFDLTGNLESGDSRAGLDDASKAAILKIMKKRRMPFDEARRVYMEQRFRENGIGADGRPRDPKFVSFS